MISGKYVGSRPMKIEKSNWKKRNTDLVFNNLEQRQWNLFYFDDHIYIVLTYYL